MLFKIKQRKQKSNKNYEKAWVQKRACNEVFNTKGFAKKH